MAKQGIYKHITQLEGQVTDRQKNEQLFSDRNDVDNRPPKLSRQFSDSSNLSLVLIRSGILETDDVKDRGPVWWRSQRYILAYLLMTGMVNMFFQRTNLSIAIICMMNHTAVQEMHDVSRVMIQSAVNESSRDDVYGHPQDVCAAKASLNKEEQQDGPVVWDKPTQGWILGAIFWTFIALQIPGGHVIRSMNKKHVILVTQVVNVAMTMLIHSAALWSPWAVFAIRLVQGGCTALSFISMFAIWTKWAPPSERAGLLSIHISGQVIGNCLVFPMSAMLCESNFLGGWPSVFYTHGGIGCVWLVCFFIFADDSPETHKFITCEERDYLRRSIPSSGQTSTDKPPYKAMVLCPAFWGAACLGFSFHWGLFLLLSTLPQYMDEVLKMDIKSNGVYSMLPFIAFMLVIQVSGPLGDVIINRKCLSKIWTRRIYIIAGNMTPAALLILMSYLDCTKTMLAVALLTVSVGATGFSQNAYLVNVFDISQHMVGPTMSLVHTLSTIPGIITPYVVAAITVDQTREQWQTVFFITGAVYLAGTVGFCTLGRGEVQPWAGGHPGQGQVDDIDVKEKLQSVGESRAGKLDV